MKIPDSVGVPLMVMVLPAQVAVTPVGKFCAVPIPVAPVVIMVILGDRGVLMQSVGFSDGVPAVLFAVTVIVPVAFTIPQPPVNGIL